MIALSKILVSPLLIPDDVNFAVAVFAPAP